MVGRVRDGGGMALTRVAQQRIGTPRARGRWRWLSAQTALVGGAVIVYFGVRNLTQGARDVAERHGRDIADLERALGIYVEETLNRPFADPGTLQTLANWIYIWGHWPVIVATMAWLAFRRTDILLRLRNAMIVSGAMGMAIVATYPVAPPRLTGLGLVDTVTETSTSYRVLQPPGFTNQYAAMPSLHAGWDLLVGISIVTAATSVALRVFGYLMPVLMTMSVVVTANHYVLDVVVGFALVLVGHWAALVLERRRSRARTTDGPPGGG